MRIRDPELQELLRDAETGSDRALDLYDFLMRLRERYPWRDHAACLDPEVDPEIFWPAPSIHGAKAKAVCARCPVREQCLEDHLDELDGVWGGLSVEERRRERVRRRSANPRSLAA